MTPEMDRAQTILDLLYKPEAVFLKEISDYSVDERTATGRFSVPMHPSYTKEPFEYVTAENYIRCLSQLSYVLVGLLIEDSCPSLTFADIQSFNKLMTEQKMWFRQSDIHYVKNTKKDTEFIITLNLKSVDMRRAFVVCTLLIGGGILRGELEFVAPIMK